jgi:hypothetical protein
MLLGKMKNKHDFYVTALKYFCKPFLDSVFYYTNQSCRLCYFMLTSNSTGWINKSKVHKLKGTRSWDCSIHYFNLEQEKVIFFCSTLSEFENFLLCERILINVKTKRPANFKGFKRFGAFKGLVEQKNVVFNSFVSLAF